MAEVPLSPAKTMWFMVKIRRYSDNISTLPNPKPAGSMPFCGKLTNHMGMCCIAGLETLILKLQGPGQSVAEASENVEASSLVGGEMCFAVSEKLQ